MATGTPNSEASAIDVARLRVIRGELLLPTSPGYDAARRLWNGAIDRRPACIARCTGVADVVAAVRFAREHDLEIAVRGAGHNVAGTAVCDDGAVIDLSAMRAVWVDPASRSTGDSPESRPSTTRTTRSTTTRTSSPADARTAPTGPTVLQKFDSTRRPA